MSPKNNTQQQQSTKQANNGNKQKVSNNQLPHRYEQRRTTDEQICAIEHEIELRRRISRIVNFNELYCETPPCGRLEDIPSEVTSIRSFDTESKKSFDADEREKDDEQSTEVSMIDTASQRTAEQKADAPKKVKKSCSARSQFSLFRERIILP